MKQQLKVFIRTVSYLSTVSVLSLLALPANSKAQISNSPVTNTLATNDFKTLPSVLWKLHINQPLMASPVIYDKMVFVGGQDSILYSIDLPSGKINWKFQTSGEIRSIELVNNNLLYLPGGDGIFYTINKNTGKFVWWFIFNKTALFLGERKYDLANYYTASPILSNNIIYFGSGDGRINDIKIENGKLVWTYITNGIIHATPAKFNNTLLVGSFDCILYELHAATGDLLWKFKSVGHEYFPKGEMQSNPIVFNGAVYIGARDFNLYALDINRGYCRWNQEFPKGWPYGNSIKDSVLYVGTSDDKFIAAIDPSTGKELWMTNTQFNIFGGPCFSQGMLYVVNLMGKVLGIA